MAAAVVEAPPFQAPPPLDESVVPQPPESAAELAAYIDKNGEVEHVHSGGGHGRGPGDHTSEDYKEISNTENIYRRTLLSYGLHL